MRLLATNVPVRYGVAIYNSRNSMRLLADIEFENDMFIYNSRNSMRLLAVNNNNRDSNNNLQ